MRSIKSLKFPSALAAARQAAGLSQKAAAISIGVDQSYLCALEKGRRPVPADELILRAAGMLEGGPETVEALMRAATHDRVMAVVLDLTRARPAARVISAALMAAGDLSEGELEGLAEDLVATHTAKKRLLMLTSKRNVATANEEDLIMR
ncbi:helix-turn-helix domain-containing protein [Paraburkholderia aspalathi]|uniref:helix-turn-helix domain-containing protein n=1 Tax=Paraburkholderia aspalathi TaxID=1324617 RepID=UPI0038B7E83E